MMSVCVENRVHFPFVGYRRLEKGEEMKGENLPKEFEKNWRKRNQKFKKIENKTSMYVKC